MKHLILSVLFLSVSNLFGQMSSAVDPFPAKPYQAKVKVKGDVAHFKYKKTDLVVQCTFTDGRIDSVLTVLSGKEELNRFAPKENTKVLELMEIGDYAGLALYRRLTEMYSTAEDIERNFMNQHSAYEEFIPNQYGNFSDGFALVKSGGKFGFIDRTGNIFFDFIFDNASNFINGQAHVNVSGVWYLLQKDGQAKLLN